MERPSCLGCLFTSVVLIIFFTNLILFILDKIFKIGFYQSMGFMTLDNFGVEFMAHKTVVAVSFIIALLPTLYFAALINDIYVKYKRSKEKEIESLMQEDKDHVDKKNYNLTLPKSNSDLIDPSRFKPPSKSLPTNMPKKPESDDSDKS